MSLLNPVIMKKNKTSLLLFFSLFLSSIPFFSASASRVMGAEMSYKWVSGNTFRFELSVYRDCGSINFIPNRQKIFYSSFSCRPTQDSISMTLVGLPIDVSPLCKREPSNCEGGTTPGIQRYRYEGVVTLPQKCTDWVFYFRLCNRSNSIQTLVDPSENCLYIEARLNNLLAPNNSSPKILNDPISYFCKGQPANFNPGVSDINGDRLKFKLVAPRTNSIVPNVLDQNIMPFKPGYSPRNPMPTLNGFSFDSLTGQIDFTPSQVINGVTAVQISEFRNGKLIGSILYDIPLIARDCENRLPTISGFSNGSDFEQLICIGDSIDTEFTATDGNSIDTLRFTWNNAIPGAVFKSDSGRSSAKARLKWKPSISDTGIKSFTLTVSDDACPSFGITTKTYKFRIAIKPTISTIADTIIPCGVLMPISASILTGVAPFLFSWTNRTNTDQVITVGHGIYFPKVTDASGCFAEDSIALKGSSISGIINQDTSCLVEGVQLTAKTYALDTNLTLTYEWTFPPSTEIFTGKVLRRKYETIGERSVALKVTGSDNCMVNLSTKFFVCPPPTVFTEYAPNICQGQFFALGCGTPGRGGICGNENVRIILTARNWISFPKNGLLIMPPDSLRPDSNAFQVTVYNYNKCTNKKDFKFRVKPAPKVKLFPKRRNIRYNCNKPDTIVTIQIYKDFRFINDSIWGKIEYLDTVINIPKTINDTLYYRLKLSKPCNVSIQGIMASKCIAYESISYQPTAQAIANPTPHCKFNDSVSIRPVFFSERFTSFALFPGIGQILSDSSVKLQYPPNDIFKGFFAMQDSLGCRDTARFEIDTRMPDSTVVFSSDSACKDGFLTIGIKDTTLVHGWQFSNYQETSYLNAKKILDTLTLNYPGNMVVKASMSFKQGCVREWDLPPVYVRQTIVPHISLQNVCADNMSYMYGSTSVSEFPIEKWHWNYTLSDSNETRFLNDSVQNPTRIFDYNGPFRSILTVVDVNGCIAKDTLDSIMVRVSQPEFKVNGNCQNDSLIFFTGRGVDKNENIDRFTYFYDDGSIENTGNGQGLHQFIAPGEYVIKSVAYSIEGCTNTYIDTLVIKPRPKADFSIPNPEICLGKTFKVDGVNSKPAAPDQSLTSFIWASNEENPISEDKSTDVVISEPGNAFIALQVKSSNGCQDYLKIPFKVRPNPVAGFARDEDDLVSKDRISYSDLSIGATKWNWDFGDGQKIVITDSSKASVSHTYTFGSSFVVKQLVTNAFGCVDSSRLDVNLKSFIALPNAFSPNGDGRNEGCGLIYRYVQNLNEFKIYNRLGQVVFDAGSDLNSRWNGMLDGAHQPNGSYLYIAKATSVFGENLELKGNITLIR